MANWKNESESQSLISHKAGDNAGRDDDALLRTKLCPNSRLLICCVFMVALILCSCTVLYDVRGEQMTVNMCKSSLMTSIFTCKKQWGPSIPEQLHEDEVGVGIDLAPYTATLALSFPNGTIRDACRMTYQETSKYHKAYTRLTSNDAGGWRTWSQGHHLLPLEGSSVLSKVDPASDVRNDIITIGSAIRMLHGCAHKALGHPVTRAVFSTTLPILEVGEILDYADVTGLRVPSSFDQPSVSSMQAAHACYMYGSCPFSQSLPNTPDDGNTHTWFLHLDGNMFTMSVSLTDWTTHNAGLLKWAEPYLEYTSSIHKSCDILPQCLDWGGVRNQMNETAVFDFWHGDADSVVPSRIVVLGASADGTFFTERNGVVEDTVRDVEKEIWHSDLVPDIESGDGLWAAARGGAELARRMLLPLS